MANIMLTSICNLNCPYCFANEFVNRSNAEITEENFRKAMEFILGDGSEHSVGLIGGEPTTHSQFEKLLRIALADRRVKVVSLYTNGILIDRFWPLMSHEKLRLLVNCNSPENMGKASFLKMRANLDELLLNRLQKDHVTLGINMYKPDFQYDYMLELLQRYGYTHVRVSISVPNMDNQRNQNAHRYFEAMKPQLKLFFRELLNNDIVPNFDCNKIPSCLITDEERKEFAEFLLRSGVSKNRHKTNIFSDSVGCSPVVDILQDLTAVRCFGLSEQTKQPILKFAGIHELKNYYVRTIDSYACNTTYCDQCVTCHHREVARCYGGCLAFKIDNIIELRDYADACLHSKYQT